MKAKPDELQMAEMQDPLSPLPHRPLESLPPYSTRHAQVHRPPHLPARHQSYSHPTPVSPSETGPPGSYTDSDSGAWRPSVWLASSLQSASPETPILPSHRYSDSSESNTSLPSGQAHASQHLPRSDGTYVDSVPPKPVISRSFTCPSGHVPRSSNTNIVSSTQVPSQLGSRMQHHSIPEESARTSPPLQHHGIPYTDFPPKGCNTNTVPPYAVATPPYPSSRNSATATHPSQMRPPGLTRQATAPTPSSYPYRQQQQRQQQQQQQQYSPLHQRSPGPTSPPAQSPTTSTSRHPTRQSSQPPPSATAATTTVTPTYSHNPKPPLIDYRRSSFPPVQTGVYRAYPIDVNAFIPPATATATAAAATTAAAVPPTSSLSSSPAPRKQTRFADEEPSPFTSSSASSTSDSYSFDDGIDDRRRRRQTRNEQVRGKKGVRRAATPRPPSSLSLDDYDDETETETETETERVAEGHRRRRGSREEPGRRRRRRRRSSRREPGGEPRTSSEKSREGRSSTRGTDVERKRDNLPGVMDLAAVFATYVLT